MRSATVIILHAFLAQALAEDSADELVKKLTYKLVDRLLQSDMDSTTLGKTHPDMGMSKAMLTPSIAAPPAQFMGCPVAKMTRTSSVAQASVKLGSDSGGLVFVPDALTIKSGESVTFTNNAGFPHNIVFDEDEVPDGANAEALSKEDYLNAPGETYTVKFDKAGTYGYYCEPHRGAGMKGKITVN